MSFPAYDCYRSITSTWLDSIPSDWTMVSLRWISSIYSGGTPDKKRIEYWEQGSIPWLNSGSVNQSMVRKPSEFITEEAFRNSSAKWIPSGGLVLALAGQGKTKGMVAQLAIHSTCNQSMAAIVPAEEVSQRYLYWWLTANYQNIRNLAGGDLRDGLNLEMVGSIHCPQPDQFEKLRIARFLDHETAKIDALIHEQERLIALLKEKRHAVIFHAVTKGLKQDVPMKDSGVEWLGEVPAHWSVTKFGYIKNTLTDYTANGSFADLKKNVNYLDSPGFARLIRLTDLRVNLKNDGVWINEEAYKYLSKSALFGGEFLLANVGAHAGLFYQMPYDQGPASLAPNMFMAKFDENLANPEFIAFSAVSKSINDQLRLSATSSAAQPKLNKDDFKAVNIVLPPLDEQLTIVIALNLSLGKIDKLLEETATAIRLLNERRSALIFAAVTGKIDVRNWQPPTGESAFPEEVRQAGLEAEA